MLETHSAREFAGGGDRFSRLDRAEKSAGDGRGITLAARSLRAGAAARFQNQQRRAAGSEFQGIVTNLPGIPFVGQLVEPFSHMRKFLGRQPPRGRSESRRSRPGEIGHKADGETRGMLEKGMFGAGRNEEDRTRGDRMAHSADTLLPVAAEVEQELSVGMAVGSAEVEGLEMPVHPEFLHRPVPATQMELPEKDRPHGCPGVPDPVGTPADGCGASVLREGHGLEIGRK